MQLTEFETLDLFISIEAVHRERHTRGRGGLRKYESMTGD